MDKVVLRTIASGVLKSRNIYGTNLLDAASGNMVETYCHNETAIRYDPTGHWGDWIKNTLNEVGDASGGIINTVEETRRQCDKMSKQYR